MINRKVSGLSLFFNQVDKINDLEKACEDLKNNFDFVGGGEFIFFKKGSYYLTSIDGSRIKGVSQKNESFSKIYGVDRNKISLGTDFGNYIINF